MFKLAFLGIVLVGFCHALTDSEVMDQWKKFQVDHEKSYKSPLEATRRLRIFRENLEKIEEHNARYRNGEETYEQGVNQFTDWTDEEVDEYLGHPLPRLEASGSLGTFVGNPNYTAPASVDWRSRNAVATPQNQGACGGCWTFSVTGSLEGQMAIRDGRVRSLSKQNLLDCARKPKYDLFGCKGGFRDIGLQFVQDNGIQLENTYPAYDAKDTHPCRQTRRDLTISGYRLVEMRESALEEAVGNVGPVSVGVVAIRTLTSYRSGIYQDNACNSGDVNHAVLAVGYGEERGVKYWIIKNSWGAQWGERGYFRLRRGTNQCLIVNYSNSYPVL